MFLEEADVMQERSTFVYTFLHDFINVTPILENGRRSTY